MQEFSIQELQTKMETGELTSRQITEMYLGRIEAVDSSGPTVNAVMEINPDAVEIAAELDAERAAGNIRGPLHGIPVMLKDNIDTADKMMTTAGSLALDGHIAAQDSFVAQKLRQAGAVILAKANLSEWANFRSTRSVSGWSSRGGQTRNPYVLNRNPCGSSSGSAAAVAANLCAAAIGTETSGSIICPAQANSLAALKPTVGLVGRSGVIPISHTQDTAGPMARSVADLAVTLGALTGIDPRDPVTNESQGHALVDYRASLDPGGLQGARIGVARNFFGFHPGVDAIMEESLQAMKAHGAEIIDPVDLTLDELGPNMVEVLLYEFKADLNAYLQTTGPAMPARTLEEIIAYNSKHAAKIMPFFGQERMELAQEKGPLSDQAYLDALAACKKMARQDGIDKLIKEHNLDAITAPSGGPAWLIDPVNGDHYGGGSSGVPAAAGYPNLTVPAGYVYGLPVGINFIGGAYQEAKLIRIAYAFEQASKVRRPPQFLESAVIE